MTTETKQPPTRTMPRFLPLAALLASVLVPSALAPSALAQSVASSAATIGLTATLTESITVSATPTSVTFSLNAGSTATASGPVAITTTWVMAATRSDLYLYGYFLNAAQALQGQSTGTIYIPASEVYGLMATGIPTSATAFTQTPVNNLTIGTASGSLELLDVSLSSSNYSGTRTDNLTLSINLSSQPQLAAQIYTGTVYLEAQAL